MPGGYRWMYYLTGLPGWMRFGFSPGWIGRSPYGLGPAAQYLLTGTWPTPQMQAYWQAMQLGQVPYPAYGAPGGIPGPIGYPQMSPQQEVEYLRQQADMLKQQLDEVNARIKQLQKEEK